MTTNNIAIIGDIHGQINKLEALLKRLKPNTKVISLGDVMEEKKFSADSPKRCSDCLELLANINAELIVGNHDQKFISFLRKGTLPENKEKLAYINGLSNDAQKYLMSHKLYKQTIIGGQPVLLVHAGVSPIVDLNKITDNAINHLLRVRYLNKFNNNEMIRIKKINNEYVPEPGFITIDWQEIYDDRFGTVIHGHQYVEVPIGWYKSTKQNLSNGFNYELRNYNVISMDTGAAMGGKLSAINIDNEGIFNIISV